MKRSVLILCFATGSAFGQIGAPSPLPSQLSTNLGSMTASPKSNVDPTTQLLKRNLYPNRVWSEQAAQQRPQPVYYGGADSKRMATGTTVIQNGLVCTHISGGRLICR